MQFNTPMLRQYAEIKASHQDAILFFRLGDFYEMFMDDAKVASKELNLTLTGRGKDDNRVPMCGIPYHSADNYIAKLVAKGHKVAICEQTEAPQDGKGITKREVVKIITPGTITSDTSLTATENNYLVAIHYHPPHAPTQIAVSFVDISTGEFKISLLHTDAELNALLEHLSPKEILLPDTLSPPLSKDIPTSTVPFLSQDRAEQELCRHFSIQSLSAFGCLALKPAFPSSLAIIDYLTVTQKNILPHLTSLKAHLTHDYLFLDQPSIQNLELITPLHGQKSGTLFSILNHTQTAMGARTLKTLILTPLTDVPRIQKRQDTVEALLHDRLSREEIKHSLAQIYDIERLLSRLNSFTQNPKDLLSLAQSIHATKDIATILSQLTHPAIRPFTDFFTQAHLPNSPIHQVYHLITTSLTDTPPNSAKDGGIFQSGYSPQLDDLLTQFATIRQWINTLEPLERTATGIKTLKVGFNKVAGYYFEISASQVDKVPPHYIRKQTLTNGERYITPELKEKETILLSGEDQQKALEYDLYQDLIRQITPQIPHLQKLAHMIATLDCIQSLASSAQKHNYIRPTITHSPDLKIDIQNSRHPVIEATSTRPFIPNHIQMDATQNRFILITGPNMAGKSTLMRQLALIVIMAQIGSFVPASSASISIVDKLFTRIGASDNLSAGQSTFMVEMLETAAILHTATPKSLILLDEIGRGTATFDGMSLACAITEYIHQDIQARTLFATHYHELTTLHTTLPAFSNYTMQLSEIDGKLVFNHKFIPGPADKSYGIHVAKMAGLPKKVTQNAERHLQGFEHHGADYLKKFKNPQK